MMIITIDGPAAAGKGTFSAYLAKKYKLAYFDTGMVYRAVGLQMVLSGYDLTDDAKALEIAKQLTFPQMIELSKHPDFRSQTGSNAASVVSAYPQVRAALLDMQKKFAETPTFADGSPANGVVYDGRDTGTVVCPHADLKLFVNASPEIRAKRRYLEMTAKGINTTYEKVLADIKARDERDSNRSSAPLKPAADAYILDTSADDVEENMQKILPLVEAVIHKMKNR